MATLHTLSPGLPTPSKAGAPLKLRDSCDACATSKLKCSKEKPTCSRCAKRNIACEYVAMKRGGRKPGSRSHANSNRANIVSNAIINANFKTQLPPSLNNNFTPNSFTSGAESVPSSEITHHSPYQAIPSSSETFLTYLSPTNHPLSSMNTDLSMEVYDSLASPMAQSFPDMADEVAIYNREFVSTTRDSSSNRSDGLSSAIPIFGDTISDFFDFSAPDSPHNNRTSPIEHLQSHRKTYTFDKVCPCLFQALGLMKQLFPRPSRTFITSVNQTVDKNACSPTLTSIISKNKTAIEAVDAMLQCPCSQDVYLLSIIVLIVSKVLGWYDIAASKVARLNDSSKALKRQQIINPIVFERDRGVDSETSSRMAAQLVLSELHLVRRVSNQLSLKLKSHRINVSEYAKNEDKELDLMPFSDATLDQLDLDLQKRLRTLSSKILDALRQL
ncbi:aflatoxin regulatory protein-domain-containing protein [Talaromyces proteolyticus]|uniref:Aflatoxin regulatory protein-domain-containing protein n=1 Tax=Talaromyces proteolyticus TaxID=1131652 RepID=A0AAD4L3C1_9EURO|nr:aflatoxin regulatory protein-domain-containing protein [Talaromyces proteolyticus]KAH8705831.1 aflatoxin regulatory protein-domain-containing protein [Talaromyces proteolyticus]